MPLWTSPVPVTRRQAEYLLGYARGLIDISRGIDGATQLQMTQNLDWALGYTHAYQQHQERIDYYNSYLAELARKIE